MAHQAEYLDGEGVVLVQLHDSLKPFLLALKKEFARIRLLEILRLRSRYAMAFYQMCCSWYGSNARSWTLSVDELREWLHIDDGELVKVNHLQSRVIDQARHELDAKARISFRVEVLKQGRKIVGWKFKVVDNAAALDGSHGRAADAVAGRNAGACRSICAKTGRGARPIFLLALGDLVEPELPLA